MNDCNDCIYAKDETCTNEEASFDLDGFCYEFEHKKTYNKGYRQGRQDAYNEIAYSDNVSKEEFEKIAYQRGREDEQNNMLEFFKRMKWKQAENAMYSYFEVYCQEGEQ